jgi:FemAB-related protein (PEP-CTERM system-associated)
MISVTDRQDAATWDEFVLASPQAAYYHLAAWQEIYREVYGLAAFALTAHAEGAVVGVLPLCHVRAWPAQPHVTSLPGGWCAASPEAAAALIEAAVSLTRRLDAAYLVLRDCPDPLPDAGQWRTVERHVTVRQNLAPGTDALWKGFSHDLRNLVRRGQRAAFDVTWGADQLDDWYPAFAETAQRKGTPVLSRRFFQAARARFPDRFTLLVLRYKGELVGGGCQFLLGNTVWCTWGAIRAPFLRQHATYLMYWEIMAHFAGLGWATVDFGRSAANSGHLAFKRRFGQPRPLFQHVWLHRQRTVPALLAGAQAERPLSLAQRVWQRLPPVLAERLSTPVRRRVPFG